MRTYLISPFFIVILRRLLVVGFGNEGCSCSSQECESYRLAPSSPSSRRDATHIGMLKLIRPHFWSCPCPPPPAPQQKNRTNNANSFWPLRGHFQSLLLTAKNAPKSWTCLCRGPWGGGGGWGAGGLCIFCEPLKDAARLQTQNPKPPPRAKPANLVPLPIGREPQNS